MFEFVNCRPDPRFDQTCWYVVVREEDTKTFEHVHKAVCNMMYRRFDRDPHNQKDPVMRSLFNVAHLGGLWLQGVEKMFFLHGVVYVGSQGGFLPRAPKESEILARSQSKALTWPERKVTVYVSRWPMGKHWYISASNNTIVCGEKFSTKKGATDYAKLISDDVVVMEKKR